MIDLFLYRDAHLIVGVEDEPDGSLHVYLDMRSQGIHTHVDDEDLKAKVRNAWSNSMSHITTRVPNEALCDCPSARADRHEEGVSEQ